MSESEHEQWSLLEFQKRFPTEAACVCWLEDVRWPNGFVCPRCECARGYRLSGRREIECANQDCKRQTSVTAGTVFHKTHTPLQKWFWAILLVSQDKGGVSALRLSKLLEISDDTAWLMLQKIRAAMGTPDQRAQLAGLIELDEAFFGRAATGKVPGKADNQAQVLVMIESAGPKAGKVDMLVIDAADEETICAAVKERVKPQQRFKTDGWRAHGGIAKMGHELEAKTTPAVLASIELPWVHKAIALAKRFILGTYHGVSKKHLQRYLDEFCYRFNRRFSEPQIFASLLETCVFSRPCTYAALIRTA